MAVETGGGVAADPAQAVRNTGKLAASNTTTKSFRMFCPFIFNEILQKKARSATTQESIVI